MKRLYLHFRDECRTKLFNDIVKENTNHDDVLLKKNILDLNTKLSEFKEKYFDNKTVRLWLMYIDMVLISCKLTEADRSGNWLLHREALSEMLPYFAVSGHHLFAKSTYFYLQTMNELKNSNPKVYELFINGFHVVRRTEFNWSGLPPDLVIEQELMRSLKSTGGMTHGRGMDELQRAKFILSTPLCSEIKCAVELLTDVKYGTSEQHKSSSQTRIKRDHEDAVKVFDYLIERNPFDKRKELMNLDGKISGDHVDVYDSVKIGKSILSNMENESVFTYSFTRKNMAKTMKARGSIDVDGETIAIDKNLQSSLDYELCPFPASLFDKNGLMRDSCKSNLSDAGT